MKNNYLLPNEMNDVGEANKIKRVILIDDDKATNYLNRKVIEKTNLAEEIITITSCEQAITYIEDKQQKKDFEKTLILLDLNMPSMDGYEFLDILQQKNLCKNLTIVIVTEFEIDGDINKFRKIENYDIILKPLIEDDLFNIWNKYFMVHMKDTI